MANIIGKRSGFDYTARWGSQLGQQGGFQLGSRPVPEGDWNEMTDEEKLATMGTTDGQFLDQAHEEYQRRSQPGGDIYNERARAMEAISGSGAQDWQGIEAALLNAGFDPSVQESGPLFKELSQIFKGNPLVNLAAQQPQNRSATFAKGMQGIRQYLPGGKEEELLRSWHGQGGKELQPLSNGGYTDGNGNYFDRFGNRIDPSTGAKLGGNYLSFSGLNQDSAYTGYTPPGTRAPGNPVPTSPGTPLAKPAPYNPNAPYSETNIPPDFIAPTPSPNSNPGNPNVSIPPSAPPVPNKEVSLNAYGVPAASKAFAWGVPTNPSARPNPSPQPQPSSPNVNDVYKGYPAPSFADNPKPPGQESPKPTLYMNRKPSLNPRPKNPYLGI